MQKDFTQLFIKFKTLGPNWKSFYLRSISTFRMEMLSSEGQKQSSWVRWRRIASWKCHRCTKACSKWVVLEFRERSHKQPLAIQLKQQFSNLCARLAVQVQCSCFIILSPISVQILELWTPQTTELGVLKIWLQATMLQQDFFSMRTFLFLI